MRFSCKKDISWLVFCSCLFADTAENRDSFSSQDKKISLWSRENSKWRLLHISWWKMPLRRFHLYSSFATGLRRSQNLSWTKGQKKRRNLLLSFINRSRKNKASFQDTHYHFQMIVVTQHTKWMNKMNLNLCCGCQSRGTLMLEFFCIVEEEKISKELLRKTFWKMGVHHHELWKSISCTHFIWRISRHRSISLLCVEFDISRQFLHH